MSTAAAPKSLAWLMSAPLTVVRGLVAGFLVTLAVTSPSFGAGPGNLLTLDSIGASTHVVREQRLVDGRVPAEASPIDDFTTTMFLDRRAFVRFDFRQPARVSALQLVVARGTFRVELSENGVEFLPVDLHQADGGGRLTTWLARTPAAGVRSIRVRLEDGIGRGALAEMLAFGEPTPELPTQVEALDPPTYDDQVQALLRQEARISWSLAGLALLVLGLLFVAQRSSGRRRVALCVVVALLGLVGWIRLGAFHGSGRVLHVWDLSHYYLGAKYFPELGHRELYRCIARWEQEQGRGFLVERAVIRDLDDNAKHPGSWVSTPEGRCRADFEAARWQAFGDDVDGLRRLFVFRRIPDVFKDHGYNGTPLQTAVLHGLIGSAPARQAALTRLAWFDFVALAGSVCVLWWGFGPLVGAAAAAVVGLGSPWAFLWTGGSAGRFFWLAMLCLGITLLARKRWLSGALCLSIAGLLRLFPLLFLAGLAAWAWHRRHDREARRISLRSGVGILLALVVGCAIPWHLYGGGVFRDFYDNSRLHAQSPSNNLMGMVPIVSAGLDGSLLAEDGAGRQTLWRRLAWFLALMGACAWAFRQAGRPIPPWQGALLASPLIFCSIPLSSYDYVFLVVLVPLLAPSPGLLAYFFGFAAASNLLYQLFAEERTVFVVASIGVLGLLLLTGRALRAAAR